jgi:uncharacterized protein YbaR (Trm112 family)
MRQSTIDKLCCPFDKADLDLQIIAKDLHENIIEGILTCKTCNRYYPIVKGVPIMSPDEYREFKLEQPMLDSWQNHLANKQVENFRLLPTNQPGASE